MQDSGQRAAHFSNRNVTNQLYLAGLQCPKLAWFTANKPAQIPPGRAQANFEADQARQTLLLSRQWFPDGVEVALAPREKSNGADSPGREELLAQTTLSMLKKRRPLFGAVIQSGDAFARVDVLVPLPEGQWEIYLVKSTTKVLDVHCAELSYATHVIRRAGVKLEGSWIIHLDESYRRSGGLDPEHLFVRSDPDDEVSDLLPETPGVIQWLRTAVRVPAPPCAELGPHCATPSPCPFQDECWSTLPEHDLKELRGAKTKAYELVKRGHLSLRDVSEPRKLTKKEKLQRTVILEGKPHVEYSTLSSFLDRLEYPLHFLEFGTCATAIPPFDDVHPWQPLPFQFSLRVIERQGATPTQYEFLASGKEDPRLGLFDSLRSAMRPSGSVLLFHAQLAVQLLKDHSKLAREHSEWVSHVQERVTDLEEPFREYFCYLNGQHNCASIKNISSACSGNGYAHLLVRDEFSAIREFLGLSGESVTEEERTKVRQALLEHRRLGTAAMIWILDALRSLLQVPTQISSQRET